MSTRHSLEAWLLAALLLVGAVVHAAVDEADQRQRIERERAAVESRLQAAEAECAERFAVSSCVAQVRAERRTALQQLDRQRAVLDDGQRKRRAADRELRIRERQDAAVKAEPEPRLPRAASASAAAAAQPNEAVQRGPSRRASATPATGEAEAARRAAASKRRAEEAAAHRAAVERRNQERALQRAPAPPLPLPSAPR